MRKEIISEDIQKCQYIPLFTFLILHTVALISGATKGLSQDSKLR